MFTSLIHLFFPPVCAGCDSLLLVSENAICSRCRHEVPQTGHHLIPQNEAFKKFYGKVDVVFAAAFLYYHKKGIVQELIHQLKYKGMEEIGAALGHWYGADLKTIGALQSVDAIIPVPLHPKKLRQRGYNQVSRFGLALSENLGKPLNQNILIRKVYSKTQTKKNLLGRSELGTKEIFDVVFSEQDHHLHFLLIDDVLTTGSTLESCSKALLKIPGARISIVCMALSHS
ncbi:ComF family protein [Flavobacterium sp.]|uniref:ComF family protein n=1 Tax=Flavobacterium sp. TaxID=239 RepID=UPI0039E2BAAD